MLGDPHQRSFPITVTASKFVYGLRSLIDAIPNSNIVLAYIRSIGPNFFGVIYIVANCKELKLVCASIYGLVRPANPSRDSLSSSPVIGINAPRSTKTIADIHHGGSFIRVKHTIAR
ncbi:hypothetical protein PGTUg99_017932 [Puccinia graminis f. sp. tritici]|uniref:Uncharacterized protein n=1 Tax=Puccinia graminis f. sp. tritici TaxID=56615 RepID=A0A5B0Q8Q2_PUCGR|nr:hypothetical protein PGTUg99_017932 [Puccinia graminis f. sp. tritici]